MVEEMASSYKSEYEENSELRAGGRGLESVFINLYSIISTLRIIHLISWLNDESFFFLIFTGELKEYMDTLPLPGDPNVEGMFESE